MTKPVSYAEYYRSPWWGLALTQEGTSKAQDVIYLSQNDHIYKVTKVKWAWSQLKVPKRSPV